MMKDVNISEHPIESNYELQGTIGVGSYGKAVVATRKLDNEKVIVKQILLSEVDDKIRQEALREAQLLAQFDHVNIIHYYECVLEEGSLNIVMEYASEGDLADMVARQAAEKKPFTEDEIMFWFVQIVLALYHVHSKNVLHRDLKSQNVFISEGNILKLGDFGISRVLSSDTELARTVIGTPYYLSPEICEDRPYNRKSDVWALGCILYELCTLRRAFDGQSLPALVVKILRGKYPPVPTRYCSSLRNLVDSMLRQNPKERPSVDSILRLSYVRGHVERYAQHVMSLSPVTPAALGITPEATPDHRARAHSVPSAAARATSAGGAGATPTKARVSVAPGSRSHSNEGAVPAAAAAAAPAVAVGVPSAADSQAEECDTGSAELSPNGAPCTHDSSVGECEGTLKGVAPPPMAEAGSAGLAGRKLAPNSRNALVGSTWMRQQHAALSELEGALALHGAGAGRRAGAGAGAEGDQEHTPAARPASATPSVSGGGGCVAGGSGTLSQGLGSTIPASMSRAKLLELKTAQREAELEANKHAVQQERERKKAAAARRSAEAAVAIRSRVAERQKEVERHLADQKAKEEEKAKRANELAQHLQSKEAEKVKLREDIAAHMAAHAANVKAAKPRINRDELAKLGADFAARMHNVPAAASPQVLVVELEPVDKAAPGPAHPAGRAPAPSSAPGGCKTGPGASPLKARAAAAAPSPAKGTPAAHKPAAQQQKTPAAEPPWRAARGARASRAPGGFPDVQIFTPFGSEITPPSSAEPKTRPKPSPQPQPQRQQPAAKSTRSPSLPSPSKPPPQAPAHPQAPSAGVEASLADRVRAAWAKRGKAELLQVLSEIQEVLAEEEEEEQGGTEGASNGPQDVATPPAPHPPPMPRTASGRPAGGKQREGGKQQGLRLPPEAGAEEEEEEEEGNVVRPSRPSTTDAAANAHKVETLRMMLEKELGAEQFVHAYRYLQDVSRQAMEREEREDGSEPVSSSGSHGGDQGVMLQRLLGRKAHLAHQIHKLITLEEKVFGM